MYMFLYMSTRFGVKTNHFWSQCPNFFSNFVRIFFLTFIFFLSFDGSSLSHLNSGHGAIKFCCLGWTVFVSQNLTPAQIQNLQRHFKLSLNIYTYLHTSTHITYVPTIYFVNYFIMVCKMVFKYSEIFL
jgi:hypothetical protein